MAQQGSTGVGIESRQPAVPEQWHALEVVAAAAAAAAAALLACSLEGQLHMHGRQQRRSTAGCLHRCPPAHKVLLVAANGVQDEAGVGIRDHHSLLIIDGIGR